MQRPWGRRERRASRDKDRSDWPEPRGQGPHHESLGWEGGREQTTQGLIS